jgi:phosphate transport system substrate-binding protein
LTYAQRNHLPTASIKNAAGQYVQPTDRAGNNRSHRRVCRTAHAGPSGGHRTSPASAPAGYPIAGLNFLIIPKDGPDKVKRTALKQFIQYVITDGQAAAETLNYAPLPDEVKQYDRQQLEQLTAAGQPIG